MTTFMTRETICSAMKLNVLLGGGGEACFRVVAKKLVFGPRAACKLGPYMQDSLYNWQHEFPYNLPILASFSLYLGINWRSSPEFYIVPKKLEGWTKAECDKI